MVYPYMIQCLIVLLKGDLCSQIFIINIILRKTIWFVTNLINHTLMKEFQMDHLSCQLVNVPFILYYNLIINHKINKKVSF